MRAELDLAQFATELGWVWTHRAVVIEEDMPMADEGTRLQLESVRQLTGIVELAGRMQAEHARLMARIAELAARAQAESHKQLARLTELAQRIAERISERIDARIAAARGKC